MYRQLSGGNYFVFFDQVLSSAFLRQLGMLECLDMIDEIHVYIIPSELGNSCCSLNL